MKMKSIDNFVSLGQDCSTLLFTNSTNKDLPSFFKGFAIYSSDYLKFFDKDFLVKNQNNIQICCKSPLTKLIELFNTIQTWNHKDKIRLNFLVIYGDKYDNGYIDVIHIDNSVLYNLVKTNNLRRFLIKIERNVIPYIQKRIIKNVENHIELFNQSYKRNLFVRTIKHHMSKKEISDLMQLNTIISQKFKKSKLLVITDIEDNLKYNLDFVKYLKFDHWHASQSSIDEFNKIVNNF